MTVIALDEAGAGLWVAGLLVGAGAGAGAGAGFGLLAGVVLAEPCEADGFINDVKKDMLYLLTVSP